jgi:PAS domain S-box-containing protein
MPCEGVQWVTWEADPGLRTAALLLGVPGVAAGEILAGGPNTHPPLILLAPGATEAEAATWLERGAADVLTVNDLSRLTHIVHREAGRCPYTREVSTLLRRNAAFVIELDKDYRITWINRDGERPSAEMVGMSALDFLPPEEHTRVRAIYKQVQESGEPATYETPTRDGTWFRVQVGVAGDHSGLCLVAQDIDAMKQAERQLRGNEARLKSLFENTPDAILSISNQGTIESINIAGERLFGYERNELIGRDAGMLLQRDRGRRFATLVGRLGGRLTGRVFEYIARRRDGREFPVSLSVGSWKFDNETRYSAIVRDLSDQKRAEVELAHANTRLVTAARRADMSDVARGALHNIGNAMTSVAIGTTMLGRRLERSRAELLLRVVEQFEHADPEDKDQLAETCEALRRFAGVLSGEQREMSKLVDGMGRRLSEITDILHEQQNYARSGGFTQRTRAASLAEDALAQHQHRIRVQGVNVRPLFEDLPEVEVDRVRLLQVLSNLVKNALESLEESNPEAPELTLRVFAAAGRLVVEISDNGKGFDEPTRTQLFRSGFTTKPTGQGLGLHYCFNSIRELGGTIHAHSRGQGQGATFIVELPCEELSRTTIAEVA